MAKKSKPKKRSNGFTVPLAIAAGFAPFFASSYRLYEQGGIGNVLENAPKRFIPYNTETGKFDAGKLQFGLYPVIVGALIHKFIGTGLGVNRVLARTGIPIIRL